jgi:predicted alpha-1,2-mannosidase
LKRALIALLWWGLPGCGQTATATPPLGPVDDPLVWVDPTIGTGGFGYAYGSCFAGAAAPNGLMKAGPDTEGGKYGSADFIHYSGYWAGDPRIRAFSHLHLHGAGGTDYGVLALMPTTAFDPGKLHADDYGSTFDKGTEKIAPGSYSVTLDAGNTRVEIAATLHAAIHRYTFDASGGANVVFDLDHDLVGQVSSAAVTLSPADNSFTGQLHAIGNLSHHYGGYDLYFAGHINRPWLTHAVWSSAAAPGDGLSAMGQGVGWTLGFDPTAGPVEVELAVSLVSVAGAQANLAAEMPAFDFDATASTTAGAWRALLGRVLVDGGDAHQRHIFYTALYHAFLMPSVASDVDGHFRFAGTEGVASDFRFLTDMSLWDTYRTLNPLYVLLAPEVARDAVRSLVEMRQRGGFFPQWPIATGDSGAMIGASAEVVIADAYVKGVTNFDAAAAYDLLRAPALDPSAPVASLGGRDQVGQYDSYGYVIANNSRSVSITTEYATDDFALGQLAAALGKSDDAAHLAARAQNWRHLYDSGTGFLRSRNADGSWGDPQFDPLEFSRDYAEANAWQTVWAAPHDLDGLTSLMGGADAATQKLEMFFSQAQQDLMAHPIEKDVSNIGPRPYYWQGNEPDIHALYWFSRLGHPDRTQYWLSWVRASLYSDTVGGLPGNDDGGTMSAWYVLNALGFYPLPGSDRYFLGAPLFSSARLMQPSGTLEILGVNASPDNPLVTSVTLDGMPLNVEVSHAALRAGQSLRFEMGPLPQ